METSNFSDALNSPLRSLVCAPDLEREETAQAFCRSFEESGGPKRYVFGRNPLAESIATVHAIDGFIDEFTNERTHLGKPVLKLSDVEPDALVVSAIIGRPLTADRKLEAYGCRRIDYFAFRRHAVRKPAPARFEDSFYHEFYSHIGEYEKLYFQLADDLSKTTLLKIVNFRLNSDIAHLAGFTDRQFEQYFEDFLKLSPAGETFADVGGFDGHTSEQFAFRCPDYREVMIFEPISDNLTKIRQRLKDRPRVRYFQLGLSDRKASLRFTSDGSASRLDAAGNLTIAVDRLDDTVVSPITFMKMDIEGAESAALTGAQETIGTNHPRLAISVYHRAEDMRSIPAQILALRDDYQIYLRHYTEGVDETVMFFVPTP